jgi:TonB family protein
MLAGVLFLMTYQGSPTVQATPKEPVSVIFRVEIGAGGGGGGAPQPAAPRVATARAATPTAVVPVAVPAPEPPPTLVAPVSSLSDLIQASGTTLMAPPGPGGGGRGPGIGPGDGPGIGPGRLGGTGGDIYGPGSGVSDPILLHEQKPEYTPDAIRMKLQGVVRLDVTVRADGTVDPQTIIVVKSLDARFGLDQKAVEAAKLFRFKPAILPRTGAPVAVRVTIEMLFTIR